MEQFEDNGNTSKSNYLCRQSSSRWIPTTDQIRILKDLYYNHGVRSPSAEQIQKISARLRQYGKIEGKNVFYWFQNHKARERQKKRFTTDVTIQRGGWKGEDSTHNSYCYLTSGVSSSSSPSVLSVGHMDSIGCCSSLVERNLKDCSISCDGSGFEWIGIGSTRSSYYTSLNSRSFSGASPDIETLQLFPMPEDETSSLFSAGKSTESMDDYLSGWYFDEDEKGSSFTSLQLGLNTYNGGTTL